MESYKLSDAVTFKEKKLYLCILKLLLKEALLYRQMKGDSIFEIPEQRECFIQRLFLIYFSLCETRYSDHWQILNLCIFINLI